MKFNFYTCGSGTYWEDVFVYQNWRIQRHYLYKEYRLLDNYDIKRESGTFEKCHKSFIEYAAAYEMEKQKEHIVIMIHGLRENKNVFQNMWRKMQNEDYMPIAINYPSTRKSIDLHIRQLNFLLDNLSDAKQVSFITKGVGGILLRKMLVAKADWKKRIKVKKVIQITPPNKGSRLFTKLSEYSFIRWWLGPMISEASIKGIEKIPNFGKGIELGIVSSDYPFKKWAKFLPKSIKAYLPSQVESDINYPNKSIYINNEKNNAIDNDRLVNACIRFMKDGNF